MIVHMQINYFTPVFHCVQVTVNGIDYQPQTPSPNKKHAKAMAATVALQALGEVTVKKLSFFSDIEGGKCYFTLVPLVEHYLCHGRLMI